jgi:uncharacterized protein (TIGR02284 family)
MSDERSEAIIQGLLDVCEDGERQFRACAQRVARAELKRFFEIRAGGCADAAQTLAALVGERRGTGDPPGDGARSGWVASGRSGDDEFVVLQQCEQAADFALDRYQDAMQADLPEPAKAAVASQYEGVLRTHDQIRALRDRAQADRDAARAAEGR